MLRNSFSRLWPDGNRIYAGSYLVWMMIVIILLLWAINLKDLVADYRLREEQLVSGYQQRLLTGKKVTIERLFQSIYEHARTISMLPRIRSIEGQNRQHVGEDVVAQGRLSLETHQTIEQIYKNLTISINLSEIYFILDGFRPDLGQVPFFMYDDEVVGVNKRRYPDHSNPSDLPYESELDEYAYFVQQLQWYRGNLDNWSFSGDITEVPAIGSPLMQTCDNSQYSSIEHGDVRETHGLLYSVPVFGFGSREFRGIISIILRANVLEAALVGVPFIPVTAADHALAEQQQWQMPEIPADFLLTQDANDIRIADRRDPHFSQFSLEQLQQAAGRVSSVKLDVVSNDGGWVLHHYLSPTQIESMTVDLERQMRLEVMARIAILLALLGIFWRANRDQLRHQREMTQLAHYDPLTLLPNRRLLYQHLGQSIARANRHKRKMGLMVVDIDDFASINGTLGNEAGDSVLVAIAERLRQAVRISDELSLLDDDGASSQVARLGGDDFAIIFEDLVHAEDMVSLGERLLFAFTDPIDLDGQKAEISLSGGVSVYPDDAVDIDELMACADYAFRHASEQGSGRIQMYNNEIRQKASRQSRLLQELPNAIRLNLFTLYYQPKQALADDRIVSFEALLRWKHNELGFISPVEFIPLLEQSGYIVEVGRWVLETACRQLKEWQQNGNPELHMSVNVSPRQMMLSDIEQTVDEVLLETGIPAHTLILEITESMMIDNLEEGSRTLKALKESGVKLAIDDFGTGYSSLTYLQELPVDYIKLDKSMIDVIDQPRGAHVIRTTILLADGLGLISIAEGVELPSQRELLKQMGCELIQGYLLSRPLPADQLAQFLTGESADAADADSGNASVAG